MKYRDCKEREGDGPMVEAYNYYAGGFIPKVNPKTNVHNRRELKNKYKSIVALNNANPLAMIHCPKTQVIMRLPLSRRRWN